MNPLFLTEANGTLFFAADDGSTGRELWKTDGTEAGTRRVKDIEPGSSGSIAFDSEWYLPEIRHFTSVGGILYFATYNGVDSQVWQSDGTRTGTVPVWGGVGFGVSELYSVGGKLFFTGDDGVHGLEPWAIVPPRPGLPGDYSQNGEVDAADFVLWRKTLGTTNVSAYSGADGEGDGSIDFGDFDVWQTNFGNPLPQGGVGDAGVLSVVNRPALNDEVTSITSMGPHLVDEPFVPKATLSSSAPTERNAAGARAAIFAALKLAHLRMT